MTPDKLYALHERLTTERETPFTSDGTGSSVHPTDAGEAWLRDWYEYIRVWRNLDRSGQHPDTLLKSRFGYVLESELPPESPHDNGRRIAHEGPDADELEWYTDTLREDDDGPEAA